jgi:hypothetical protein
MSSKLARRSLRRYLEIWEPLVGRPAAVARWQFIFRNLYATPVNIIGCLTFALGLKFHMWPIACLGLTILVFGGMGLVVASRIAHARFRKLLAQHYGLDPRRIKLPPNSPDRFDDWRRKWVDTGT